MATAPAPPVTSPSPAAAPVHKVNRLILIYHADLLLLIIVGVFALLTLPRAIARFSRWAEWTQGNFLYSCPTRASQAIPMKFGNSRSLSLTTTEGTVCNTRGSQSKNRSAPTRVRSVESLFHPIFAILSTPIIAGYSVFKVFTLAVYFAILLAVSLYSKSSVFADPVRNGFIALSQLPIVFALGTKNNVFGWLLGVGYEKLNYLHRFGGRLAAVAASLHVLSFFYKWCAAGTFTEDILEQKFLCGFLAVIGIDLLAFFSTSYWRQNHYNVFLYTHIVGFILFPVGVCLHTPEALPFAYAAAAAYGLDHLFRLIKTRVATANLHTMQELGITRIEVPSINSGWRAGQHVRIRVLSTGMGILGWSEVHPFTIASAGGDGLTLMCKKTGAWTNSLFNMAKGGASKATVVIEGPYGGVGHTMMDAFSGAFLVAGGSGITFPLSTIHDLVQKNVEGATNVRFIHLVWCVQDAASLTPMLSAFSSLIEQSGSMHIQISVFYTRASTADPEKLYPSLPKGITINVGRPKLDGLLDEFMMQTLTKSGFGMEASPQGVVVGVCGPAGLGEQVRKTVANADQRSRDSVGGVELCEEIFGW